MDDCNAVATAAAASVSVVSMLAMCVWGSGASSTAPLALARSDQPPAALKLMAPPTPGRWLSEAIFSTAPNCGAGSDMRAAQTDPLTETFCKLQLEYLHGCLANGLEAMRLMPIRRKSVREYAAEVTALLHIQSLKRSDW